MSQKIGNKRILILTAQTILCVKVLPEFEAFVFSSVSSSLGRYVFGSEISYNKAPPRLPGLGC
jgi:hypothetical protein